MSETTSGVISDLPSHPPPAEVVPKAMSVETSKEASLREKAQMAIASGADLITEKSKFFDTPDKVDAKRNAEKFLEQVGKKALDSDGLKAFFISMDSVGGEEAGKISEAASEDMLVKVGDRMLSYEDWKEELNTAKNPPDGTPDPQKIQELEEGVFGYSFPETTEEPAENINIDKEKSPEDQVISDSIDSFEAKIKRAKEQGISSEELEETLVLLKLAEEAEGDAGVIIKSEALKSLLADYKMEGIGEIIDGLEERKQPALDKIVSLMGEDKGQEFIAAVKEGKLEDLIREGKLFKVEGMRELLFGQGFTEKDLKEIVSPDNKKKWKSGLLLALMIMMVGSVTVGQESIKTQ